MQKPDEDREDEHRYFAIESNNRAWELATKHRTDRESLEMLSSAHASAFHWDCIGTELNRMRATMLLAEVHALVGLGESAFKLAEQMRQFFLGQETPDWEIAFVHTIHAHAALVSGDVEQHKSSYFNAEQAIADIADDTNREVVMKTFQQITGPEA